MTVWNIIAYSPLKFQSLSEKDALDPFVRYDEVSLGSDQLYSWGGVEGTTEGYPGPSTPPQRGGFGGGRVAFGCRPQTPTQECKVRKNLVYGKPSLTSTV